MMLVQQMLINLHYCISWGWWDFYFNPFLTGYLLKPHVHKFIQSKIYVHMGFVSVLFFSGNFRKWAEFQIVSIGRTNLNPARSEMVILHYITFPGSKVSQNDCRMWNKSYKYKKHLYSTTKAFQKYIHTHINQDWQLTLCTETFKRMSHFCTML
jgi:hypothetical protein